MRKWLIAVVSAFLLLGCSRENLRNQKEAQAFIDSLSEVLEPLQTGAMQLFWEATSTGSDSLFNEYAESENKLMKIYNNPAAYQHIRKLSTKKIKDPILAREIAVAYNEFLINQADTTAQKNLSDLFAELYTIFQNHIYKVGNREVPVGKLREKMRQSTDSAEREKTWKALKQTGPEIEGRFKQVVCLLNASARSLGFKNYYEQRLITQEEDPRLIEELVRQYAEGMREPYRLVKIKIDSTLAAKFKIKTSDLQAWHHPDPFASDSPFGQSPEIDQFYQDKDVVEIARRFFSEIGFDIDEIIRRSDLTERPAKYRQSYSLDITRQGDVRVMANISNDARGMNILMHELGHAVHFMNISRDLPYYLLDLPTPSYYPRREIFVNKELPYLLRDNTHFFIAEGVAAFFANLTTDPNWMEQMLGLTPEQKAEYIRQMREIRPARELYLGGWMLVMFYFEKALYENPEQDLNKLWWDLVEKYQLIKRPEGRNEPDWACNFHLVILPLYYQNYLLGDVFAAQLLHAVAADQDLNSVAEIRFTDNKAIGDFLKGKVLSIGKRYRWDELVKRATGEELTVKYYLEQRGY